MHRQRRREKARSIAVDFPRIERLDQEAEALGVSRQAVVKTWIAERLRQKI